MTYDFHGTWDKYNEWTGPYLKGHTNLAEVQRGLDLLWRNNVKPENVVFGFGFYGRSVTMVDATGYDPNAGCQLIALFSGCYQKRCVLNRP
jgi:GH18 family chitinase